ncbi:MAG: hypothetical protein KGN77_00315 [Xanthomonadaceae bacterium]|nr:hypothetical protein [Xanthomonadaceae bacterium]MDE1964284.1 hypothetical protein [Xanthomonadaceae bacterium]
MLRRAARLVFAAASACVPASVVAQAFSADLQRVFREAHAQKSDLGRYLLLKRAMATARPADLPYVAQLFAFSENELGLYNEALRDFPLRSAPIPHLVLPDRAGWVARDAAAAIADAVGDRRLVLINEAHHDAHTRELTLQLLARLRTRGFGYFAAEALSPDPRLAARGYPVMDSGSEYLHEPLYGEMVREALRLGYKVIAYDPAARGAQRREREQAVNLFNQTFRIDPAARVLVHAGFAHIDKQPGRLGSTVPMGKLLGDLVGQPPYSIDQTQFREQHPSIDPDYLRLTARFEPAGPTVLAARTDGRLWSAAPQLYDASVILPPEKRSALSSGAVRSQVIVQDSNRPFPMVAHVVDTQRPAWISLGGRRRPFHVRSQLCRAVIPCVVEARYEHESADAVPADRYMFAHGNAQTSLYLFPGRYRLTAHGPAGEVLANRLIEVGR